MAKKVTKNEKYVQFCPKCGSKDIGTDNSNSFASYTALFEDECYNCGNIGRFPEMPEDKAPKSVIKSEDVGDRTIVSIGSGKSWFYAEILGLAIFVILMLAAYLLF
ncbi:hypothetical protein HN777_01210 [Candidatus Woesearchaeota archaeon]|jgi:hypothetical protein|nr:hypothetical protein [Candidatus Woesearchaeota archaeon]MBT7402391.1 hypothetical protein [Candidatus Woesearchaeota archaeon]